MHKSVSIQTQWNKSGATAEDHTRAIGAGWGSIRKESHLNLSDLEDWNCHGGRRSKSDEKETNFNPTTFTAGCLRCSLKDQTLVYSHLTCIQGWWWWGMVGVIINVLFRIVLLFPAALLHPSLFIHKKRSGHRIDFHLPHQDIERQL